jgi:tetratricopeptide (TPR) repeat protein
MLVDNLNTCAENLFMSGKLEEALAVVTQAYDMARSIHNEWGQVFSLMITAMICSEIGDATRAIQAGQALFALDPGQGFALSQIGVRGILSDLYIEFGQTQKAYQVIRETYQIPEGLKPGFRPPIFACWARLELRSGNLAEAEKLLDQALEDYDPENFVTFSPFYVALAQDEIHTARGEHLKALACLDEYIEALYSKGVFFGRPEHLLRKARVLITLNRKHEAMAILQETVSFATPLNFRRSLWKVYALISELQDEFGHFVEAQQSRKKARAYLDFLVEQAPPDLRESILQLPEVKALLSDR